MNKTIWISLILVVTFLVSSIAPINAQMQFSKYSSDPDPTPSSTQQQANGVNWQLLKDIEDFFNSLLTKTDTTNDKLQTIINNQQKELNNQNETIQLLIQLVNNQNNLSGHSAQCWKQGSGVVCNP